MEEKINKLEQLISDWRDLSQELEQMAINWNDHDDPGSDPGLQFEKGNEVQKAYNNIKEYASKM